MGTLAAERWCPHMVPTRALQGLSVMDKIELLRTVVFHAHAATDEGGWRRGAGTQGGIWLGWCQGLGSN